MAIKMELEIEQIDNKFYASLTWVGKGKKRTFMSLWQKNAIEAVCATIQPLMVIAPNFTQEEIDKHYKKYL